MYALGRSTNPCLHFHTALRSVARFASLSAFSLPAISTYIVRNSVQLNLNASSESANHSNNVLNKMLPDLLSASSVFVLRPVLL